MHALGGGNVREELSEGGEGKRREQANYRLGDMLRHFGVGVAFRHACVWQGVDSSPRPIELPLSVEANEVLPWQADGLDIAGPNHSVLADILHNLLKRLGHSACLNTSLLNNI